MAVEAVQQESPYLNAHRAYEPDNHQADNSYRKEEEDVDHERHPYHKHDKHHEEGSKSGDGKDGGYAWKYEDGKLQVRRCCVWLRAAVAYAYASAPVCLAACAGLECCHPSSCRDAHNTASIIGHLRLWMLVCRVLLFLFPQLTININVGSKDAYATIDYPPPGYNSRQPPYGRYEDAYGPDASMPDEPQQESPGAGYRGRSRLPQYGYKHEPVRNVYNFRAVPGSEKATLGFISANSLATVAYT